MTDNDLHVKLKPAVKVFLINQVLTCTAQNIFQERHLNCWWHLLLSYTGQKVCFLSTNYRHNEFAKQQIRRFIKSEHRSEGHHGHLWATWTICCLTTTPLISHKTFFPDDAGFSYLLSKARVKIRAALQKSYTPNL